MKFVNSSAYIALFLGATTRSTALKCGIAGVTKQCLGKTDARYNSDASYDLADQDDFWGSFSGLYIGDYAYALSDGTPMTQRTFDGIPGSFDFSAVKRFANYTVSGSRLYFTIVHMAPSNTPGDPGIVIPGEVYLTSTFEKDATASLITAIQGFGNDDYFPVPNSTFLPNAGKALFGVAANSYESLYCTSPGCASIQNHGEMYMVIDNVSSMILQYGGPVTRVDEVTWETEFENTYAEFNIPTLEDSVTKVPSLSQLEVSSRDFITGYKFSEEDWQKYDPEFGTTPYAEPDGTLTGGFIAGVTIASIIVAVAILVFIYKHGVEAREKHAKNAVAIAIAKTMKFTGSARDISPSDLQEMFAKIDTDGNGAISKDEIKTLVDESGVANMSAKDYDTLFASIDIDGNGTLSFAEFCAFYAAVSSAVAQECPDNSNEA